jgi:hypothetical protein
MKKLLMLLFVVGLAPMAEVSADNALTRLWGIATWPGKKISALERATWKALPGNTLIKGATVASGVWLAVVGAFLLFMRHLMLAKKS